MKETIINFVTGCDSYYYVSWLELYVSIKNNIYKPKIYFYDLGLNNSEREQVLKLDVIYRKFSFEKYPEWVNIRNEAGQWAWKSQCIKQVTDENSINNSIEQYVIWCDSRNKIRNNLKDIFNFIDVNGIYTNYTSGNVINWTVRETINYLGGNKYENLPMRNAALPAFNINIPWVREFINEYARLSLIKECIAPEGSSRLNHRQDQSILTILYYKYKDVYNFRDSNFNGGISIHTNHKFVRPFKN